MAQQAWHFAGLAQLTVDFRHPDKAVTLEMEAKMREAIKHAEARAQVEVEVTSTWEFGDEAFDADYMQLLRETANDLGVEFQEMLSQAGHDAVSHDPSDSDCTDLFAMQRRNHAQ